MYKPELVKKIREDFPAESIQIKRGFKDPKTGKQQNLIGYKPQYIIERLNDCFGHDGWDFEILEHKVEEVILYDKKGTERRSLEVYVLGQLSIMAPKWYKENEVAPDGPVVRSLVTKKQQFGLSSVNMGMPLGDALKSAATNAMEKCASMLDIGAKAYKGLEKVPDDHKEKGDIDKDNLIQDLISKCKKYNIDKEAFPILCKNVLGKEDHPSELSNEEINKLIVHIEKNKAPF